MRAFLVPHHVHTDFRQSSRLESWRRQSGDKPTTPVGSDLREVTLKVTVHYSQRATHEPQAFDAKWQFGEELAVNVPMTAAIQGYDIKVTDYDFRKSGAYLGTVPINSSFRTTSE